MPETQTTEALHYQDLQISEAPPSRAAIPLGELDVQVVKEPETTQDTLKRSIVDQLAAFKADTLDQDSLLATIREYIQRFDEAGGTVAELFSKLPKSVDVKIQNSLKDAWVEQNNFVVDQEFLDLLKPDVFAEIATEENPEEVRLEMLGKRIYDYTVQYHENTSLLEKVKGIDPTYEDIFKKAVEIWEKSRGERQIKTKSEQLTVTHDAIAEVRTDTGAVDSTDQAVFDEVEELDDVRIDRSGAVPMIEGVDSKTKEKKQFPLKEEFLQILPSLLYLEAFANIASGHNGSELMMLVDQVDSLQNGPKTNEQLLISVKAPPEAVRMLQEGKVHEQFFSLFKGKEQKLLAFFEKMGSSDENMYVFLQNMSRTDLEILCKNNELPGGIQLQKDEVDHYVLSKITKYQKRALGIEDAWRG